MVTSVAPPRDLDELLWRAGHLAGRNLGFVAEALGMPISGEAVRTKGKIGELLERALGASGGSAALHDFPALDVELKTIPVDAKGRPHESTFVCAISLDEAEYASWDASWVRAKLSAVLWVPIGDPPAGGGMHDRLIGTAQLWRPTLEQCAILRADFDDLMGRIGMGGIEGIKGSEGRWLQIRPKAASGSVRTRAYGPEGESISTVPRGFYLRARFTGALLTDPAAIPLAIHPASTASTVEHAAQSCQCCGRCRPCRNTSSRSHSWAS